MANAAAHLAKGIAAKPFFYKDGLIVQCSNSRVHICLHVLMQTFAFNRAKFFECKQKYLHSKQAFWMQTFAFKELAHELRSPAAFSSCVIKHLQSCIASV